MQYAAVHGGLDPPIRLPVCRPVSILSMEANATDAGMRQGDRSGGPCDAAMRYGRRPHSLRASDRAGGHQQLVRHQASRPPN